MAEKKGIQYEVPVGSTEGGLPKDVEHKLQLHAQREESAARAGQQIDAKHGKAVVEQSK